MLPSVCWLVVCDGLPSIHDMALQPGDMRKERRKALVKGKHEMRDGLPAHVYIRLGIALKMHKSVKDNQR